MKASDPSANKGSAYALVADDIPLVDSINPASPSKPTSIPAVTENVPLTAAEYAELEGVETMLQGRSGRKARRWIAFTLFMVTFAAEAPCFILAGIASANLSWLATREKPYLNPGSVIIVTFISLAEVAWVAITGIFWACCGLHPLYFPSFGLCAISSLGAGIFALVMVGTSRANSICSDDLRANLCEEGLRKALAAGLLKILLTAPCCAAILLWYLYRARKGLRMAKDERRRRREYEEQRGYANHAYN